MSSASFKWMNPRTSIHLNDKSIILNTRINSRGSGNSIYIGKRVILRNCRFIFFGNNNSINIGDEANLYNVTFWLEDNFNKIEIGQQTTTSGAVQFAACEGSKITIGDDCMFSHDIFLRTTDSHSIVNFNGCRINLAKDIYIGRHVWVGMQSLILKGVTIPEHCIIGARSLVTASHFDSYCVIAGFPARMLRKGVDWKVSSQKKAID